jgi:hypothetical protein
MLPSLWRRLTALGPSSSDELALARYYRDEGLQVELESLRYRGARAIPVEHERMLYAARSYFAA